MFTLEQQLLLDFPPPTVEISLSKSMNYHLAVGDWEKHDVNIVINTLKDYTTFTISYDKDYDGYIPDIILTLHNKIPNPNYTDLYNLWKEQFAKKLEERKKQYSKDQQELKLQQYLKLKEEFESN